ncbi:MAG: imidazolonepropionase [Parvularculaceae bacterium]
MFDTLFINTNIAAMAADAGGAFGAIEDAALGVSGGRIDWVGRRRELSAPPQQLARDVVRLDGAWMTPALVDCHTHLVFGGDRAREFEMRQQGASYEEIARAGGGIVSTVKATRDASLEDLVESGLVRARALMRGGVGTIEIKSGYGLDPGTEAKMLIAAGEISRTLGLRVKRTLLAAHAVPPEYSDNRESYVSLVCDKIIPEIAERGLADAVDAFCETIGFTAEETRRVFNAAHKAGLPVKLHAEQLSNLHGAALAAEFKALSADHLEYIDEDGVIAMAEAGTTAVLLPGAFYALRETRKPPVDLFRKHGVKMALASDLNPGTSPALSPTLMMNMGAILFAMTPEEALAGMTRHGAAALGLEHETGSLSVGKSADLAIWRIQHPAELAYWMAHPGPHALYVNGVRIDG